MDALNLLLNRTSSPRLVEPAPEGETLATLFAAAARAPDHARLRPWRFLTVRGEARQHLGELLEQGLLDRNPAATDEERAKARQAPLRAPLLIVVVCRLRDHPKVPPLEQWLSAACAAHGILLAAQAQGFGGVWRTGDYSYDNRVMQGLGLDPTEKLAGFIYVGTPAAPARPLADAALETLVSDWPEPSAAPGASRPFENNPAA